MSNEKSVVVKKTYDINSPAEMTKMATVLKAHIVGHKLYTNIGGKNYAHVEGWQFAGGMVGLMPIISEILNLSKDNEIKWTSECEIRSLKNPDMILGRGFALCSNKESKKKSFDEYAILSMAQTRSIGKAYRNMLGWVMKLAGYESTPSEEMTKVGEEPQYASGPTVVDVDASGEELYCHGVGKSGCPHGATITRTGRDFTVKMYGKPLCRNCTKEAKPLKGSKK